MKRYLSKHFTIAEAVRSEFAARNNIPNPLPDDLLPNATRVCEDLLEPVRAHFGIPFAPQSFYRCPQLNAALGGSENSDHCKALAADIELPGVHNLALAEYIASSRQFYKLILEFTDPDDPSAGWIHVSLGDADEHRILRIYRKPGEQRATTELVQRELLRDWAASVA